MSKYNPNDKGKPWVVVKHYPDLSSCIMEWFDTFEQASDFKWNLPCLKEGEGYYEIMKFE